MGVHLRERRSLVFFVVTHGGESIAWLEARYGRKVRFKDADIEVEAQTMAEVDKLLARAQQRNQQPKVPKKSSKATKRKRRTRAAANRRK